MLYVVPKSSWDYYAAGGQYRLLRDTKDAIETRYRRTDIRVDRLVVQVLYADSQIEVQPVFEGENGDLIYPDTYYGGSWKVTKPRLELQAIAAADHVKNQNLRRLCKMTRAWKNKHGVAMGGLLIDSLAHRFFTERNDYDDKSYSYFDFMVRDFFYFLSQLPVQDYFQALGSRQRVHVKKNFQRAALKAYNLCEEAIGAENSPSRNDKWRRIFGRGFPPPVYQIEEALLYDRGYQAKNTEQFIEDRFALDIRYPLQLECEVKQAGFRNTLLRSLLLSRSTLYTRKSLRFYVESHGVPGSFALYWKVLNRGYEAIKRDNIRGQIFRDTGGLEQKEETNFRGDHMVECYAVQNGAVVARDRIHVPIREETEIV